MNSTVGAPRHSLPGPPPPPPMLRSASLADLPARGHYDLFNTAPGFHLAAATTSSSSSATPATNASTAVPIPASSTAGAPSQPHARHGANYYEPANYSFSSRALPSLFGGKNQSSEHHLASADNYPPTLDDNAAAVQHHHLGSWDAMSSGMRWAHQNHQQHQSKHHQQPSSASAPTNHHHHNHLHVDQKSVQSTAPASMTPADIAGLLQPPFLHSTDSRSLFSAVSSASDASLPSTQLPSLCGLSPAESVAALADRPLGLAALFLPSPSVDELSKLGDGLSQMATEIELRMEARKKLVVRLQELLNDDQLALEFVRKNESAEAESAAHPPPTSTSTSSAINCPPATAPLAKRQVLPYAKLFDNLPPPASTLVKSPAPDAVPTPPPPALSQVKSVAPETQQQQPQSPPDSTTCRKWNRGDCFKGAQCHYRHVCLHCAGDHPRSKCPQLTGAVVNEAVENNSVTDDDYDEDDEDDVEGSEACIKWNYNQCQWGDRCHRAHKCIQCAQRHRVSDCVDEAACHDDEVCFNWNSDRCRMGDRCKRQHKCLLCGSLRHRAMDCDSQQQQQLAPTQKGDSRRRRSRDASVARSAAANGRPVALSEVCLNWNSGRCNASPDDRPCRRMHVCSVCGQTPHHPAIVCKSRHATVDTLADAGIDICLNWNRNKCSDAVLGEGRVGANCRRLHVCSNCHEASHAANTCPRSKDEQVHRSGRSRRPSASSATNNTNSNVNVSDVCLNWNHRRCRQGENCRRRHICLNCLSRSHTADACPSAASSSTANATTGSSSGRSRRSSGAPKS